MYVLSPMAITWCFKQLTHHLVYSSATHSLSSGIVRFTCTFNANLWLWFNLWLPKPRAGILCDPDPEPQFEPLNKSINT